MSTREALARLLEEWGAGEDCGRCADAILAEFLVVPRSEMTNEYGVEYRTVIDDHIRSAEVARDRVNRVYGGKATACSREVWTGPWSPLPDTSPCPDCGYPEGRQADCGTCHGVPLPENGDRR